MAEGKPNFAQDVARVAANLETSKRHADEAANEFWVKAEHNIHSSDAWISMHLALDRVEFYFQPPPQSPRTKDAADETFIRYVARQTVAKKQAAYTIERLLADGRLKSCGILHTRAAGEKRQEMIDPIGREWWVRSVDIGEARMPIFDIDPHPIHFFSWNLQEIIRVDQSAAREDSTVETMMDQRDLPSDTHFRFADLVVVAAVSDVRIEAPTLKTLFPLTAKQEAALLAESAERDQGGPTPDFALRTEIQRIARDVLMAKRGDLADFLREVADRHSKDGGRALDSKDVERLLWPDHQSARENDARRNRRKGHAPEVAPQAPHDAGKKR